VRGLFLAEAGLIASLGAAGGVALGLAASFALGRLYPQLPIVPPLWAVVAAVSTALLAGLLFAWLPARRAAKLDAALSLTGR
jgi:putative ABC transport system permease protein